MANKKLNNELLKSLSIAKSEKDVENAYRHMMSHYFPASTTSPNKVDGFTESGKIKLLMEFKYKSNLKDKLTKAEILVQLIYYLKRLEKSGVAANVIFSGDIDECFCMSTGPLYKYLSKNLDWSIAPSSASSKNPELISEIVNDKEIAPFIYDINKNINSDQIAEKIKFISEGKSFSIGITKHNIVPIFKYFQDHVVTDKFLSEKDEIRKISRAADLFISCLTDSENTFLHPNKQNILRCRGESIKVNANLYISFFSHFKQDYTVEELRDLTSCKDRIIEEIYRRRTGAFFTPTIWVDEAHKMMAESLGPNWYDEYVVWDCAAGTAQLTRDYNFKELYISTLEKGDIDIIRDMEYNRGATIFQYDFLSEVGIEKVPVSLRKLFEEKKKILFLINPPYGKAAGKGEIYKSTEKGSSNNIVNDVMKSENYGNASPHLYFQFIFKIMKLIEYYKNDVIICTFAPPVFMTGPSFKKAREKFYNIFSFENGFIFQASEFSNVNGRWGISFTVWKPGKNKKEIVVSCRKIEDFEVKEIGKKNLYSTDNEEACNTWVRREINGLKTSDEPKLSSAIKVVENEQNSRKLCNSIGSMYSVANNVDSNMQSVALFSSSYSNSQNAFPIVPENFYKAIALLAARTIESNWINWTDEYIKPSDEILNSDKYKQWNNDAIILSIPTEVSSLRQILYKKQKWNIFNHFFFMSNKEMMELANKYKFPEMYEDARKFNEDRYVYKLLESVNLSPDAKQVLEYAREMIRKSIELRKIWHEENPEYHLDAWDAGYAQHRELWKKHFKKEFDVFKELYKSFGDRMREGVYKFGFLK